MDRFYERFLDSSETIPELFDGVEMSRVKSMVRQSFIFIMLASEGSLHSIDRVKALGQRHHTLSVKSEHYDLWLDSLLSIVEELDTQYSIQTETAWREVMAIGIDLMKDPKS